MWCVCVCVCVCACACLCVYVFVCICELISFCVFFIYSLCLDARLGNKPAGCKQLWDELLLASIGKFVLKSVVCVYYV